MRHSRGGLVVPQLGRGIHAQISGGGTFPLALSPNARFFRTAAGAPFRMNECSAWGLIARQTLAEAKAWVDQRVSEGFNAMKICLVVANNTVGTNDPTNETWNGSVNAFTTPGDYSTPNPTYFTHADDVLNYCASKGVLAWVVPVYLGWYASPGSGSWQRMQGDSDAHLASFGTFCGNRYKSFANVGWCLGGDQYAEFRALTNVASREQSMITALKAAAPSQFYTAHLDSSGDSVRFQDSGMYVWDGTEYRTMAAAPWGANGHYAFAEQSGTPVYTRNRLAYNTSPTMPHFALDESYEGEVNGTAVELRRRQYRVMCEGGCGGSYNRGATWYTNFQVSTTSQGLTENLYWDQFWALVPWSTMAPDQAQAVATSGYGTYGGADYVCTLYTSTCLVSYFPSGGGNTLVLSMSSFARAMRARWFDPTAGFYTLISSSIANSGTHSFPNPGTNSAGDSDWLLILD